MQGVAIHRGGTNPPVEKKIAFHNGEGNVCLEHAGIWEVIPDPEFVKFSQRSFEIDTSHPNVIDFIPSHFSIEGQLRFVSE